MELIKLNFLCILSGFIFGFAFSYLKLPLPAPSVFSGVLGIFGVWLGYFIFIKIFGG